MKIEEAIQQKKPFRNPWQRAAVNLMFTHNWVVDQIKCQLKAPWHYVAAVQCTAHTTRSWCSYYHFCDSGALIG